MTKPEKIDRSLPHLVEVEPLKPYEQNARTHSAEQIEQIKESFRRFGFVGVLAYDEHGLAIGHGRREALLGMWADGEEVLGPGKRAPLPRGFAPAVDITGLDEAERRALIIADNKLALNAGWDDDLLRAEIEALRGLEFDMPILGFDEDELKKLFGDGGDDGEGGSKLGALAGEFLIPPLSVLNAREGWWQDRKRAWLGLGIKSEVGRGENLLKLSDTLLEPDPEKRAARATTESASAKGLAVGITNDAYRKAGEEATAAASGTSIFDPVLCELAYRWFSPEGGLVLDPFAGGSVRGIVAGKLGRRYLGIDLRPEQVEANEAQRDAILGDDAGLVGWRCGDASDELPLDRDEAEAELADLVFSCPPYGDLEVYSDDPRDLSTMKIGDFIDAYQRIIRRAVDSLKPDRFAAFVVGDYRDDKGFYSDFVSETIRAFDLAGAKLYNEAILVTAVGSLAIRAGKAFRTTRKMGKTHQQLLVFCKGDPRKATEACGPVDVEAALAQFEEQGEESEQESRESAGLESTKYGERVTSLDGEI
jgi:hypothetical protein